MRITDPLWTDKWSKIKFPPQGRDFSAVLNEQAKAAGRETLFGTDEEPGSSLWVASLSEAMGESFREGMTLLDYGCGAGRFGYFLALRLKRFQYFGLEKPGSASQHGEWAIKIARELFANDTRCVFNMIGSDLEKIAIERADVAVLGSVFTHLDAEEVPAILRKLQPVVARGGKIVFSIFLADRYGLEDAGVYGFANAYGRSWFTEAQLRAFVAPSGAVLTEQHSFLAQGVNMHRIFALANAAAALSAS